ncbi:transglutaminaseTgpA domain-containing protein [Nibricoccus sp. IMCC34717]|uniref:transglutaminase family protein n=1 Tax=Nibricoccus sp. IMCC34717 TaxID=3034021 RepID=UPI00384A511F
MSSPAPVRSDLQPVRWLLGAALAGVAFATSMLLAQGFELLGLGALAVLVLAVAFPAATTRLPRWLPVAMFPLSLAAFATDYALTRDLVPALVRLDMLLLLYRACTPRKRRDDLQVLLLGLFLIVITGVLTTSLAFGVLLVLFVGLGMALLTVRTLAETASGVDSDGSTELAQLRSPAGWLGVARHWRRRITGATVAVWVALTAAMLPLAAFLFLVIPRFELRQSLFLERFFARPSVTGFTETVRFGEVSQIQQDRRVAFRFDAGSRPAASLYWRMVVLDEYANQGFRASAALQAAEFGPVRGVGRITDTRFPRPESPFTGSLYFEPGISRYLPLTGPFRSLDFSEPQLLRRSASLGLLRLDSEPSNLRAWRIQDMDTSGVLSHPAMLGAGDEAGLRRFLQLPFAGAERQALEELAEAVRLGARDSSRRAFVDEASRRLRAAHGYSLQMQLPPGAGDPLLRWMRSREPGHCELFAGSLVMLCRAAGIPARMVAGFAGGEWNEDYLIVRNSDAHAWVEFLDGSLWVRADPTQGTADETRPAGDAALAALREAESGWASSLDRLRVVWYRRVVNFDQQDQQALIGATGDSVRSGMQSLRQNLLAAWRSAWNRLPSDFRMPTAILAAAAFATIFWATFRLLRTRLASPAVRRRELDRRRREAARWLERLQSRDDPTAASLRNALQLIRFGAEEHWPEPRQTFAAARRLSRAPRIHPLDTPSRRQTSADT